MKRFSHAGKFERPSMVPVLERQFLRLYSRWHETHDVALEKRVTTSLNRLLQREPGFDFRKCLWQIL